MLLKTYTIKQKLIFINLLSFVVIFIFAALIAKNSYTNYQNSKQTKILIERSLHLSVLVHELQKERAASSGYLDSHNEKYKILLNQNKRSSDRAFNKVQKDSTKNLNLLPLKKLRQDIATHKLNSSQSTQLYSSINDNILNIITTLSKKPQDIEVRNLFSNFVLFLYAKEKLGVQRAIVTSLLAKDTFTEDILQELNSLHAEEKTLLEIFSKNTSGLLKEEFQKMQKHVSFEETTKILNVLFSQRNNELYHIADESWFYIVTSKINELHAFEQKISSNILTLSEEKASSALRTLILIITVTTIIFLYTVLISYSVALNISNSYNKVEDTLSLIDKNVIVSETDLAGIITYASDAFCTISGYKKEELLGQAHNIVRHEDMPKEAFSDLWKTIKKNHTWTGEVKNKKKDGGFYWVKAIISPKYSYDGDIIGYVAIRQDITDKKKVEELSITDGLTNLYNRRHFNELFPKKINIAKRNKKMVCFLMFDVDFFKPYNDTYGHQKGDEALIQIANTVKATIKRAGDYPFRLGGEEFGILFESNSKEDAANLSNTLKTNIQDLKIAHEKNPIYKVLTVSMGLVCKVPQKGENGDNFYKEVDDLLYQAKASGRNKLITCENSN